MVNLKTQLGEQRIGIIHRRLTKGATHPPLGGSAFADFDKYSVSSPQSPLRSAGCRSVSPFVDEGICSNLMPALILSNEIPPPPLSKLDYSLYDPLVSKLYCSLSGTITVIQRQCLPITYSNV